MDNDFKALISSAKKGDRHSFAQLYSSIYKDLYKYALYTLRNEQDAEDCVSEAVIDAYRTIGNLKDDAAFKAWFFKILSTKCKRKIKEYYKTRQNDSLIDESFDELDTNLELKTAFFALSPEDRMIVSLNVFGGYNSQEIAKIIRMNRNTVRSRYSRALEKMRSML